MLDGLTGGAATPTAPVTGLLGTVSGLLTTPDTNLPGTVSGLLTIPGSTGGN